jgi:hypothetical protein
VLHVVVEVCNFVRACARQPGALVMCIGCVTEAVEVADEDYGRFVWCGA